MSLPRISATTVLAVAALMPAAQAGELYSNIGLPGWALGYAQPLNTDFTLRGDYATLGNHSKIRNESGIDYLATLKASRGALLADWYPFSGSFRFSGGVTFNSYQLDLDANGGSGSITIGGTTYATTAADQFDVAIKFPKTTPYFGFGWGHQNGSGLRFAADLGASFGKATLSYRLTGPNTQNVTQADIDSELSQLRDGVGKVRWVPQLSLGIGYSF